MPMSSGVIERWVSFEILLFFAPFFYFFWGFVCCEVVEVLNYGFVHGGYGYEGTAALCLSFFLIECILFGC